jgi:hypothetical protein
MNLRFELGLGKEGQRTGTCIVETECESISVMSQEKTAGSPPPFILVVLGNDAVNYMPERK